MTALHTIGFAGKSLEEFLTLLRGANITRLLDVRLRPDGHLSAYARQRDLRYILEHYEGIAYEHRPELAPTAALLDGYRADRDWARYRRRFQALLRRREWEEALATTLDDDGARVALLCSEAAPERCHRRLVAEAYARRRPGTEVRHLVLEPASRAAAAVSAG